ncbi:MAG: PUA domain-containing protein [Nitrososphaerales archaeon]
MKTRAKNPRQLEVLRSKFKMSIDYIFEKGSSQGLDSNELEFELSPRTGRPRYVLQRATGSILFSFRANGSIAPTLKGAEKILTWSTKKRSERLRWVVTVIDGVSEVVSSGKTVFCKHVLHCDDSLRANEDVAIMNGRGDLLAVGRSTLSGPAMKQFKRGVAVKVREGSKGAKNVPATDEF